MIQNWMYSGIKWFTTIISRLFSTFLFDFFFKRNLIFQHWFKGLKLINYGLMEFDPNPWFNIFSTHKIVFFLNNYFEFLVEQVETLLCIFFLGINLKISYSYNPSLTYWISLLLFHMFCYTLWSKKYWGVSQECVKMFTLKTLLLW